MRRTPDGGWLTWPRHATPWLAGLACLLSLSGCAQVSYLAQSVAGHWQVLSAARPVPAWLADPATPPALREQLQTARELRTFAVQALHLPDNASYTRYADLGRRHVVWNVVAAPPWSLTLTTWCFPVAGCVGYRGYFDEAQARAFAEGLRRQGLEVSVYGVPAYSTLGWSNWLGGDPLLNTWLAYPQGEVARLLFHELAHQVLYVPGDMAFNESFATAVERLGSARWLAERAAPAARQADLQWDARRQAFRQLTRSVRTSLAQIYEEETPLSLDIQDKIALKNEVMARFRQDYAALRQAWGGYPGYDAWVAQANNAAFGALAAYDNWVGAFEALFAREGQDWPRFLAAARRLADSAPAQRLQELQALQSLQPAASPPPDRGENPAPVIRPRAPS